MDRGLMTVIGSYQVWPEGLTWVFQGTVAETADAGTHVVTLTVTPGMGNEMQLQYGEIASGNTATAQTGSVFIDDGANGLVFLIDNKALGQSTIWPFPQVIVPVADGPVGIYPIIISGTMRLILRVSTTAVSVTQTFAVVCRIKGSAPTAVLNDTVGIFTPTTNTSKVFG